MKVTAIVSDPDSVQVDVTARMNIAQWELILADLKWHGPANTFRTTIRDAISKVKENVTVEVTHN